VIERASSLLLQDPMGWQLMEVKGYSLKCPVAASFGLSYEPRIRMAGA